MTDSVFTFSASEGSDSQGAEDGQSETRSHSTNESEQAPDDPATVGEDYSRPIGYALDEDAVLTDTSCPHCLAPEEKFREKGDDIGCGGCGAVVPVDADWYQEGEKIVVSW